MAPVIIDGTRTAWLRGQALELVPGTAQGWGTSVGVDNGASEKNENLSPSDFQPCLGLQALIHGVAIPW